TYDWKLMSRPPAVPVFDVTVAGAAARVIHDGRRWSVLQGHGSVDETSGAAPSTVRFVQREVGGAPFVALDSLPGPVLLCPGRLLANVGDVAIVERSDAIVACRLELEDAVDARR